MISQVLVGLPLEDINKILLVNNLNEFDKVRFSIKNS